MNSRFSLFDFFDRSYIINLPERADRRQEMERELKRFDWPVSSDRVKFFSAIKPHDKGEFPSIGARGCFLSHLEVLKEAKSQNLNNLLIMEDDLSFTQLLIEQQDKIVNALQRLNWGFAYLGHGVSPSPHGEGIFQEYSEPLMLKHFTAINQQTIIQLVDFLEEVLRRPGGHPDGGPMHVDGAYSTFRQQNSSVITLIANPSLGFQRSSPSSIAGYKWFDALPMAAQLANSARKVKNWHRRTSTI
jgi:glycosyl transferase family 25